MCQYCSEDHNFWDEIVRKGRTIRILTADEVAALYAPQPAHHPDCPRGQHCWCPAGLLVPGYADSADGQQDAADQARWDTQ